MNSDINRSGTRDEVRQTRKPMRDETRIITNRSCEFAIAIIIHGTNSLSSLTSRLSPEEYHPPYCCPAFPFACSKVPFALPSSSAALPCALPASSFALPEAWPERSLAVPFACPVPRPVASLTFCATSPAFSMPLTAAPAMPPVLLFSDWRRVCG